MMKRLLLIITLVFLPTFSFSGDIATFVNLGFSNNSKYFMFGLYGIEEKKSLPYAEIYTVDVGRNRFVTNGIKKKTFPQQVTSAQEGQGALFSLLHTIKGIKDRYGINHIESGRPLYILINGQKPKSSISFRDFITGHSYTVYLNQEQIGSGSNLGSTFHISLNIKFSSGAERDYTIGLPNYKRIGVLNYRIRQILISPNSKHLVFIVEKEEKDGSGVNVRYMVETVAIN
jgi:predicted secreted protein